MLYRYFIYVIKYDTIELLIHLILMKNNEKRARQVIKVKNFVEFLYGTN